MDQIYTVSQLTAIIKDHLEYQIPPLKLEAEVSELKFHSSGHWYLTLKDEAAVISAVMWRTSAAEVDFRPEVGMKVIAYGKLAVYAPQGKYQFTIRSLTPAGKGQLYEKFEELKRKLLKQGRFDSIYKQIIPKFPDTIGLITSETGAALQDMQRIFALYAPHVRLLLAPARVQGSGGAESVIDAIDLLEKDGSSNVMIIARGGGSIEDLWEFNKENLAERVFNAKIPVISGIGHETDTTMIDFIADYRASTPTGAAEYAVRNWREAQNLVNQLEFTLFQTLEDRVTAARNRLEYMVQHYGFRRPKDIISQWLVRSQMLVSRLEQAYALRYKKESARVEALTRQLTAYRPENILKKGFVIVRNGQGNIITTQKKLNPGESIHSQFQDGIVTSTVETIQTGIFE